MQAAVVSVVIGFSAWIADFFFCSYFQRYNLHAFAWHPLTAASLYYGGVACVEVQLAGKGDAGDEEGSQAQVPEAEGRPRGGARRRRRLTPKDSVILTREQLQRAKRASVEGEDGNVEEEGDPKKHVRFA